MPAFVLCLCPNDHVLFDAGAIVVDSAGQVREAATVKALGLLRTAPSHKLDWSYLGYHRETQQPDTS